jgi:hypothetical protein
MSENLTQPTVPEMLRMTGTNTADFMNQIATHIEKLEEALVQLKTRVAELEKINGNDNTAQ